MKSCIFIIETPLIHDIMQIVYDYLSGVVFFKEYTLSDVSQVTFDCVDKRTLFKRKIDDHPVKSVYFYAPANMDKNKIWKHKSSNLDAFYDESCLSRVCNYVYEEESTKMIDSSLKVTNSDNPSRIFFQKNRCYFYHNNKHTRQKITQMHLLNAKKTIFSHGTKIFYYAVSQCHCQILLERVDVPHEYPFVWTVYKKKILIIVHHKSPVATCLLIYKMTIPQKKKSKSMTCSLVEKFSLPELTGESWKIQNDDFHNMIYLVDKVRVLQLEIKEYC